LIPIKDTVEANYLNDLTVVEAKVLHDVV